jgi:hypothetical protein
MNLNFRQEIVIGDFKERKTSVIEKHVDHLHSIPTFVTCSFLKDSIKWHRTYKGFIENISLNELSLELRDDYFTIQESLLIYSPLEMSVVFYFPDGSHKVTLAGIITQHKRVRVKEKCNLLLGVRLDEPNEKNREILNNYLNLGIGDTNLIWNLWDNLLIRT